MELTQKEQQKQERILKREDTLRDLQDNIKKDNIPIIVVTEEKRDRKGVLILFEKK